MPAPTMERIDSGAEAVIYKEAGYIVKERISKSYRHERIDSALRKFRTKREAKVLAKLAEANFPAPKLVRADNTNMQVVMDFIAGKKLKDALATNPGVYAYEIGKKVGKLHNLDIIHSDLTTSNMILNTEIFFIDFGLSFFSKKVEDKAVDLHLFRRALESKHYQIFDSCWRAALCGYKETAINTDAVLNRLEKVEKRGRNKIK